MKTTACFLSAVLALPLLCVSTASADDANQIRFKLNSTTRGASGIEILKSKNKKRNVRPVDRVKQNTAVNKYEGRATIFQDRVTSPEIIFHLDNGQVRSGHVYDR